MVQWWSVGSQGYQAVTGGFRRAQLPGDQENLGVLPPEQPGVADAEHILDISRRRTSSAIRFKPLVVCCVALAGLAGTARLLSPRRVVVPSTPAASEVIELEANFNVGQLAWVGTQSVCAEFWHHHSTTPLRMGPCRHADETRFIFPKEVGMIRWAPKPDWCMRPAVDANGTMTKERRVILDTCDDSLEAMQFRMPSGKGSVSLLHEPALCLNFALVQLENETAVLPILNSHCLPWQVLPAFKPKPPTQPQPQSLFCFCLVRKDSYEAGLMSLQQSNGWGVFRCDRNTLFSTGGQLGSGLTSVDLGSDPTRMCDANGKSYACNVEIFIRAWDRLFASREYRGFAWTVKVDADAAFFPDRLKWRLGNIGDDRSVFFENSQSFPGLLGPIEVFSKAAVDEYAKRKGECNVVWRNVMGEDDFIHHCFKEILNVPAEMDIGLLGNSKADAGRCGQDKVTYHYYKTEDSLQACYYSANR